MASFADYNAHLVTAHIDNKLLVVDKLRCKIDLYIHCAENAAEEILRRLYYNGLVLVRKRGTLGLFLACRVLCGGLYLCGLKFLLFGLYLLEYLVETLLSQMFSASFAFFLCSALV